jgi:hypothetical protein
MDADQRRTLSDLEIGHIVSVDAKGLHGRLVKGAVGEASDERGRIPDYFTDPAAARPWIDF